jgi:hypothetical protein
MKWDASSQKIAGDIVAFVDNLRAWGHLVEQAWAILHQVVARLQYLGLQDAPRKRPPPVQTAGAWAGAVFQTTDTEVIQTVSQDKWLGKGQVSDWRIKSGSVNNFNYKRLEQI